jgi:hypothetical protein
MMDSEKIETAINAFEEDDFVTSKETIKDEFIKTRDAFLKDKLELKNDINPIVPDDD